MLKMNDSTDLNEIRNRIDVHELRYVPYNLYKFQQLHFAFLL